MASCFIRDASEYLFPLSKALRSGQSMFCIPRTFYAKDRIGVSADIKTPARWAWDHAFISFIAVKC